MSYSTINSQKHDQNGVWVISDVHGCFNTLLALIKKLPLNSTICFVGDLIDRGKENDKIIDYVKNNNLFCVLGNHEKMMIDGLNYPSEYGNWIYNGGGTTIDNYEGNEELLKEHLKWIQKLPLFEVFQFENQKDLIVSHSNILPFFIDYDIDNYSKYEKEEIIWNRLNSNFYRKTNQNIFNIYGHTPVTEVDINECSAMIDTGCVYNRIKYNNLTAIHYPSLEIIQQQNIENE